MTVKVSQVASDRNSEQLCRKFARLSQRQTTRKRASAKGQLH